MKTRYKFLYKSGKKFKSHHGEERWTIGEWQHRDGEIILCENGYHCSKTIQEAFSYIQGDVLAVIEVKGESDLSNDKEAYSDMRIIRAYEWTARDSRMLVIFATEQVLDIYEKQYPNDMRPRQAIEASKKVLEKDNKKNRDSAYAAADAAADAADAADRKKLLSSIEKWLKNHVKELEEIR